MSRAESTLADRGRTFALIHGAWDGGWAWAEVARLLRAAGHEVYTPTLTGLGERVHLRHPGITLDTHVQDVVNVLVYEDLQGVILVGWSYGGAVITGVAEQVPERIAQLAYLDAFVPQDGQSLSDLVGPEVTAQVEEVARTASDGWRVPHEPIDDGRPRTDALLNTLKQPLSLTSAAARAIPRTHILCTEKPDLPIFAPIKAAGQRARSDARWQYRELPTGHEAVWTMPHELSGLLLDLT